MQNNILRFITICFLLIFQFGVAQVKTSGKEVIQLVHADKIEKVPGKYDGNLLHSGNVIFYHKGTRLKADSAVFYQEDNFFQAFSHVEIKNPEYDLKAEYLEYNGNTELAIVEKNVVLRDSKQTLYTSRIEFDRKINKAYYNNGGTIVSKENTITSTTGTYDLNTKVNTFDGNVFINNDDYFIDSQKVNFNSRENYVEFFDRTMIQSKKNSTQFIKTTKGKYYLNKKEAFLKERSSVYSEGKSITADDLYYNQATGVGKGEGDVFLDDPKQKMYVKGEFAKFYKELDSAFVTRKALAVRSFEKDSLYLHADTLMVTKKDSLGLVRAYKKAKFFKSNIQGKSDSIVFSEKTGSVGIYKSPIVFSDYKQVTGDTIIIYLNTKREQLDSMRVRNNAFAIAQRDSIHIKDFNQLKSKNMSAVFKNDSLEWFQAMGNAQSTLYLEEDKKRETKELLGINRSDCGIIEATFYERKLDVISCRIDQKSRLYPPFQFPEDERYLPDFVWRGKERFTRWQDIMKEDASLNKEEPNKEKANKAGEAKLEKETTLPKEIPNGKK